MKEVKNHPYMDRRTIKAWETDCGKFMQIIDVRDIYFSNYSVEYEVLPGGLDSIYSSPKLSKCFAFVEDFKSRNLNK